MSNPNIWSEINRQIKWKWIADAWMCKTPDISDQVQDVWGLGCESNTYKQWNLGRKCKGKAENNVLSHQSGSGECSTCVSSAALIGQKGVESFAVTPMTAISMSLRRLYSCFYSNNFDVFYHVTVMDGVSRVRGKEEFTLLCGFSVTKTLYL